MNELDTEKLFLTCPYAVRYESNRYTFKTDYDIVYAVSFDKEEFFSPISAYWFNLTNRSNKPSPNDPKVRQTVVRIITEFFQANPDILLYMCDSANDQQAQRNRLFLRWFSGERQSDMFCIRTAVINDEGTDNFIALIVPRNHKYLKEILNSFEEETSVFRESK
ncbi:MAG: hypothetical protein J5932_09350 [Prevotella sp.]|jgi:hypothetical protein|nr:hypothetical protein [Prevotella sp.]